MTPPKIFIFATSGDLSSARQIAKDALLTINCHPVEQTNFEPDWRSVTDMLRGKIGDCQALIHLVGFRYGAEPDPASLPGGTPRRSYTQMEYHLARELGLRVYTFLLPETYPFDVPAKADTPEKSQLQAAHRALLQSSPHLYEKPASDLDLRTRIIALHEKTLITLMPTTSLPRGFVLHNYELQRNFGDNDYATYYLAKDTTQNIEVVVKELFPFEIVERARDTSLVSATRGREVDFLRTKNIFLQALENTSGFNHPAILKVIETFEANNTVYVVNEFVGGQLWEEWVVKGPPSEAELRTTATDMLHALDAIHCRGFLHQNIDPQTIRFRKNSIQPVLMDFYFRTDLGPSTSTAPFITPHYSPFESFQTRGKTGPPSDIYSLGAVLFLAVTGVAPPSAIDRISKDILQPLAEREDLPYTRKFLETIDKAIRVRYADRWQSAQEWLDALGVPRNTRSNNGHSDNLKFDVFVSSKSQDFEQAREVAAYLTSVGLRVFFSEQELAQMGNSDYFEAIDTALEAAEHMVVVTSSRDNALSQWVKKEWQTFLNEKISGRKRGNLVTLLCGQMTIGELPLSLRQHEASPKADLPKILGYFRP